MLISGGSGGMMFIFVDVSALLIGLGSRLVTMTGLFSMLLKVVFNLHMGTMAFNSLFSSFNVLMRSGFGVLFMVVIVVNIGMCMGVHLSLSISYVCSVQHQYLSPII